MVHKRVRVGLRIVFLDCEDNRGGGKGVRGRDLYKKKELNGRLSTGTNLLSLRHRFAKIKREFSVS